MGPTGWVEDPVAVETSTVEMGGDQILFGNSPLKDFHKARIEAGEYGAFPFLAEKKLFGRFQPAFHQRRGTCVGQGTARALQDSWYSQLLWRASVGKPKFVAVAPIYAGGRIQIGQGRIRGDGLVGSWAAQFVAKYGAPERGIHGRYDLTAYNGDETYAVNWGSPGVGVPQEVLDAGTKVKIRVYRCMTGLDIADAIYARFGVAFCGGYTGSAKDANGYSRLSTPANHCTEIVGACLSPSGELYLGGQQSWGPNNPRGSNILRYKGGEQEMRDGMWFSPLEDFDRELKRTGEAWAFQYEEGYR